MFDVPARFLGLPAIWWLVGAGIVGSMVGLWLIRRAATVEPEASSAFRSSQRRTANWRAFAVGVVLLVAIAVVVYWYWSTVLVLRT
jgi:type VI protein secretion system component VasF